MDPYGEHVDPYRNTGTDRMYPGPYRSTWNPTEAHGTLQEHAELYGRAQIHIGTARPS